MVCLVSNLEIVERTWNYHSLSCFSGSLQHIGKTHRWFSECSINDYASTLLLLSLRKARPCGSVAVCVLAGTRQDPCLWCNPAQALCVDCQPLLIQEAS